MARRVEPGRRERKRRETREKLINAAAEVFAEQGFAATSLDEVAEAAGLTKGAVYSNFESKFGLAIEVLDRCINRALSIFTRVDPQLSLQEQFLLGATLFAQETDAWSPWFRLELECTAQAHLHPDLFAKIEKRYQRQLDALSAALAEHLSAFGVTDLPWEQMANTLMVVSYGVSFARLRDPAGMPVELIARILASVQAPYLSDFMTLADVPA